MKTMGLIGGVSWESTAEYYRLVNESVKVRLAGLSSSRILINSMNYEKIVSLELANEWGQVGEILAEAGCALERAGADFVLMACNTLHKVAPKIESALRIPFLHIADPAGEALVKSGVTQVGLLGTRFTMEEGFYARRLEEKFRLKVIVPDQTARRRIDDIIYKELCVGKFLESSRRELGQLISSTVSDGAQAVLLGCTELGMLLKADDASVPMFDTPLLHARFAAEMQFT